MIDKKKRDNTSTKRKVLEIDDAGEELDATYDKPEKEEVHDPTLNDLEFSLNTDPLSLIRNSKSEFLTNAQVGVLKLVICSGLYPNIAIADDSNHTRRGTEHFFHTKTRKFVVVNPGSIYSLKPELLVPKNSSMVYYCYQDNQ
jgi:ATP-dependent RNA helicase DHX34